MKLHGYEDRTSRTLSKVAATFGAGALVLNVLLAATGRSTAEVITRAFLALVWLVFVYVYASLGWRKPRKATS